MAPIWRVDGVFDVKTTATTAKIRQDPLSGLSAPKKNL